MKSYTQIGSTLKPHGIQGALKCRIEEQYLEDFFKAKKVILELRGTKLPFFIEKIQDGNATILHLKTVKSRNAAVELSSKPIFLNDKDILETEEREIAIYQSPYAHLEGFTLKNTNGEILGVFSEIREMPAHDMGILMKNGAELMIPLVEQFVVSEDEENKEVIMELPEGLI